jgi:UDP-glucose 4-epimerase
MSLWLNKSVLITGGLGMLGSTIATKLVKLGANVTVLDALLPGHGGNKFNVNDVLDHIEIVIGDIRDKELVETVVDNKDIIFNLAAQVNYTESVKNPYLDLDINCNGHLNILEACRKSTVKPLVIFSSSRMVYGKTKEILIDESHETNPLMPYAIHKLTGEKYHLMYWKDFGVPCMIVRIANPYGPRQQMEHSGYGILNWFIKLAMSNNEIQIFGTGEQMRDYVYVEDICNAMIKLAEKDNHYGNIFNLGSGEGTSFKEMVNTIVDVVGRGSIQYVDWPQNYSNVETGDYISNIEKLKSYIDWFPDFNLRTGIAKTFEYYVQYKKNYW